MISANPEAKAVYNKIQSKADKALKLAPHPLERIQTNLYLDSDPIKKATWNSLKDMQMAYSLSIAYILTDDAKYPAKAKEYILTWAKTNIPTGDPIDELNLEPIIRAYDLVKDGFSSEEKAATEKWLERIAECEMASRNNAKNMGGPSTAFNNWNSPRLKIIGLIAFTLKNEKYTNYTINGFKRQIADDLRPDGQSYDFQQRDALHYHCMTLEPLLTLCIDAKLNGYDLYGYVSPKGCSLQKSVDFLMPYAAGEKVHEEFVHSRVKWDNTRGDAGQKDYQSGRLFRPEETLKTLTEYYFFFFFNPGVLPLIQKLANNNSAYPSWEILLESAQRKKDQD